MSDALERVHSDITKLLIRIQQDGDRARGLYEGSYRRIAESLAILRIERERTVDSLRALHDDCAREHALVRRAQARMAYIGRGHGLLAGRDVIIGQTRMDDFVAASEIWALTGDDIHSGEAIVRDFLAGYDMSVGQVAMRELPGTAYAGCALPDEPAP